MAACLDDVAVYTKMHELLPAKHAKQRREGCSADHRRASGRLSKGSPPYDGPFKLPPLDPGEQKVGGPGQKVNKVAARDREPDTDVDLDQLPPDFSTFPLSISISLSFSIAGSLLSRPQRPLLTEQRHHTSLSLVFCLLPPLCSSLLHGMDWHCRFT